MFSKLVSDFIVMSANRPNVSSKDSPLLMGAVAKLAVGVRGLLPYPPPYLADDCIT